MYCNTSAKGYMVVLNTVKELDCGLRGGSQSARAVLVLRTIFLLSVKCCGVTCPEILAILLNFQMQLMFHRNFVFIMFLRAFDAYLLQVSLSLDRPFLQWKAVCTCGKDCMTDLFFGHAACLTNTKLTANAQVVQRGDDQPANRLGTLDFTSCPENNGLGQLSCACVESLVLLRAAQLDCAWAMRDCEKANSGKWAAA